VRIFYSLSVSRHKKPSFRAAFTLTELAVVLGVIGILLAAIWSASSVVSENNREKIAISETLTIVNNWRGFFASKKVDLAGAIMGMTVNYGFAPAEMINPALGATYCAASGNDTSVNGCLLAGIWPDSHVRVQGRQAMNGIGVSYNVIPPTACVTLAKAMVDAPGLISITIGPSSGSGTPYTLPPYGTDTLPSSTTIDADCSDPSQNFVDAVFSMN
jgi:prepilin-type N-terminal cleavage/methylation domain-containing protein